MAEKAAVAEEEDDDSMEDADEDAVENAENILPQVSIRLMSTNHIIYLDDRFEWYLHMFCDKKF